MARSLAGAKIEDKIYAHEHGHLCTRGDAAGAFASRRQDSGFPDSVAAIVAVNNQRYLQLDGVRGIAILGVLLGHTLEATYRIHSPLSLGAGECGVLLFFVLSGYLITDLLIREETSTGRVDVRAFYIRRALRLLPAMFLYVGTVVVLKLMGVIRHETWGSIGASILYVRNIFGRGSALTQLWSLSLEEQFYLTWPAVFVLSGRRRASVIVAILVVMTLWRVAAIQFHLTNVVDGRIYEAPWFRYDSILYGCILAVGAQDVRWGRGAWVSRLTHPLVTLPVLMAASCIRPFTPLYLVRLTLQSVAMAGFLWYLICARPQAFSYRILAAAPFRYLGRISYSLYLWQGMFIWLPGMGTDEPSWTRFRSFPLNLGITFVLAVASHELLERPFLRLKSRFTPARTQPTGTLPVATSATADESLGRA